MTDTTNPKHDLFKIILSIGISCVLMVICFSFYCEKLPEIVQKLNEKGDYANVIWLVEHVVAAIPVFFVALTICLFYSNREKYVAVHSRKEQLFISCVVAAFVYVAMLGCVLLQKGEIVVEGTEEVKTLWDIGAMWFFAQIIPFLVLIGYHSVRVESEEKELLESCDGKKRAED